MPKSVRPGYKEAILDNDDTEFLHEENPKEFASVTAAMVADLFGKSVDKVVEDIARCKERME